MKVQMMYMNQRSQRIDHLKNRRKKPQCAKREAMFREWWSYWEQDPDKVHKFRAGLPEDERSQFDLMMFGLD